MTSSKNKSFERNFLRGQHAIGIAVLRDRWQHFRTMYFMHIRVDVMHSMFHWINRNVVALRAVFPTQRSVDDVEEIYDWKNQKPPFSKFTVTPCQFAPACMVSPTNFMCFSILRSIHLFLGRKPPDAIRGPVGESRCHNLSRKAKNQSPFTRAADIRVLPIILFLHAGCGLPSLCHGNLFWSVVHMLRGPLFCWYHNGKTRFPLELLEMLFYASNHWNQIVRV